LLAVLFRAVLYFTRATNFPSLPTDQVFKSTFYFLLTNNVLYRLSIYKIITTAAMRTSSIILLLAAFVGVCSAGSSKELPPQDDCSSVASRTVDLPAGQTVLQLQPNEHPVLIAQGQGVQVSTLIFYRFYCLSFC
jgi:hypothetical protein